MMADKVFMVDTEEMQAGGGKVVEGHRILRDSDSEFVGLATDEASFNIAGHRPDAEILLVMNPIGFWEDLIVNPSFRRRN